MGIVLERNLTVTNNTSIDTLSTETGVSDLDILFGSLLFIFGSLPYTVAVGNFALG